MVEGDVSEVWEVGGVFYVTRWRVIVDVKGI